MFKAGLLIKLLGKPVLFLSKKVIEEIASIKITDNETEITNLNELFKFQTSFSKENKTINLEQDVFENLITYNGSLKKQINQAKAAIAYPPHGLATLILGQTGVGKTLFANMISTMYFAGVRHLLQIILH